METCFEQTKRRHCHVSLYAKDSFYIHKLYAIHCIVLPSLPHVNWTVWEFRVTVQIVLHHAMGTNQQPLVPKNGKASFGIILLRIRIRTLQIKIQIFLIIPQKEIPWCVRNKKKEGRLKPLAGFFFTSERYLMGSF